LGVKTSPFLRNFFNLLGFFRNNLCYPAIQFSYNSWVQHTRKKSSRYLVDTLSKRLTWVSSLEHSPVYYGIHFSISDCHNYSYCLIHIIIPNFINIISFINQIAIEISKIKSIIIKCIIQYPHILLIPMPASSNQSPAKFNFSRVFRYQTFYQYLLLYSCACRFIRIFPSIFLLKMSKFTYFRLSAAPEQ